MEKPSLPEIVAQMSSDSKDEAVRPMCLGLKRPSCSDKARGLRDNAEFGAAVRNVRLYQFSRRRMKTPPIEMRRT